MKLIDKDALVAEIEERKKEAESNCGGYKSYDEHCCNACIVDFYEELLEIINTIEVKEVDCEREIGIYTTKELLKKKNHSTGVFHLAQTDINSIAKHFYELGLKTRKEE